MDCRGCLTNFWTAAQYCDEDLCDFLIGHNVIKSTVNCAKCDNVLELNRTTLEFRCRRKVSINKQRATVCNWKVSARTGSLIGTTKLDLIKLWRLLTYLITHNPPRHPFLHRSLGLSHKTIVDWFSFYREVIIDHLIRESVQLGGPGEVVEIDEAKFGKRKYNRGRLIKGQWVLGGIQRSDKATFLLPVPDRSAKTLIRIIRRWVAPGTTIVTDCWRAYNTLSLYRFNHLTVNHVANFVDPDTGAHTNTVERGWRSVRAGIPKYGRREQHFIGYLAEYIFKKKYPLEERHHVFFKASALLYPPKY